MHGTTLTHDEYLAELRAFHARQDARWAEERRRHPPRPRKKLRRMRNRGDFGRKFDINALDPERLDRPPEYLPPLDIMTGLVA